MQQQDSPAAETTPLPAHETYLSQLIEAPRMVGLAASRSGEPVLTVQTLNKEGAKYRPRLWALPAHQEEKPYPLTAPDSGAALLALDEEGRPYLTLDKDLDQAESKSLKGVYRLPERGEPELVLSFPGGINELEVRQREKDPRYIFTAKAHRGSLEEQAKTLDEREKSATSGVLYSEFPTRFWDHDLGTGKLSLYLQDGQEEPRLIHELGEGALLSGFTVCPGGSQAALTVETKEGGIYQRYSVWLIDLDGQTAPREIAAATATHDYIAGSFTPEGTGLAVTQVRRWLPGQSIKLNANHYNLATGAMTELSRDIDRWADDLVWLDEENYVFSSDNLGASAIYRGSLKGTTETLVDDGRSHFSLLAYNDGALVALKDSHQHSAYPVRIDATNGRVTRIASPVEELKAPGKLERLTSTAADGTELTSFLALPENCGTEPLPLLVFAHGGPWGSWNSWSYRWNPWVFTQAGYAVLMPDPAISTGYGQDMLDRGGDDLGGTPYRDIMQVVEEVSARPDIQGDNLAFSGGSYGGFMTNWVAGRAEKRFKCYITHASIWDYKAMYFLTDNGAWNEWKLSQGGEGDAISPYHRAAHIAAPMLVIHGDKDYRVPIGQAHHLWADLQHHSPELGHKFLYFPDEGHWILKPGNSRLWYRVFVTWLNQHLGGQEFQMPEILG
ncbi:prolyl oligopeptidase family serine peptidase [Rothia sp. P5766]|uniref:S9 family peptidase n=1 Tax=Rothia sp. P5766 TaxID=3402656 RepID=UPI003AE57412